MKRVLSIAGVLVLASAAAGPPAARQAAPQFRSTVELVHLDVSVLDRDRRPVHGLSAADFVVRENGRPQAITAFTEVHLPDPAPPPVAWMREVAPDVRRNDDIAERRLVLIVMDDATIPFDPQMIAGARTIGRTAVERLGPADLAAVVFTRDNRHAQDFTSDRTRLLAAVESFNAGSRTVGLPEGMEAAAIAESSHFLAAVETLNSAAEHLAAIPQRRKALIYVSVGVPVDLDSTAAPAQMGLENGNVALSGMHTRLVQRMNAAFRTAQRANVNIYAVDPAGPGGMEQYIQSLRWQKKVVPAFERANNYLDFLQSVAGNTGGRAFTNSNEFASAVTRIFAENGSYYLLGFSPDRPQDTRFRRLEVTVDRPGVTVRARSGYYASRPDEDDASDDPAAPAPSPLAAAVAGLLPKADLPMQAAAAAFGAPGRRESTVAIVARVTQPIAARAARTIERADLSVQVFTPDGRAVDRQTFRADIALRPGGSGDATYELLARLELRPGRYQLRLAADAAGAGPSGSVFYDLDVPDVRDAALSISDIALSAAPGPAAAPRDLLAGVVPILPTSAREFLTIARVTAFARLAQGGGAPLAPVTVTTRVRDSRDRVVFDRQHVVAAAEFAAARTADLLVELPMAQLWPGPHLLEIDAAAGPHTARQRVRFDVR
jgi:VWFA-related protein